MESHDLPIYEHVVCGKEGKIEKMAEDIASIKISLGYKDKYNGAFRQEVEETDKNLNERLRAVESSVDKISTSVNSIKWIMALLFPVFAALMIEILVKL